MRLIDRGDGGVVSECGTPEFPDGTGLRRRPYLQFVTPTSARVMWTSTTGGTGHVRFQRKLGGAPADSVATYEHFPVERTSDVVAYGSYVATLRRLQPDSDYCYEVYEDGVLLAAGLALHSAWTQADKPIHILAFGDSGSGAASQLALRDQMTKRQYDLFLHLGDIAYPVGSFDSFERYFFNVYADILHATPVYPVLGNHEYYSSAAQPYIDVFNLPLMAWRAADDERYYSFDLGAVHFVALDSNPEMVNTVDDVSTDDMVDWLRDDLRRSKATWKIALFHHPVFSSGAHGPTSWVQDKIMGALEDGGVDLVLNGHDHSYERTVPIWRGAATDPWDPRAITYLVAGAGGASLYGGRGDWFHRAASAEFREVTAW